MSLVLRTASESMDRILYVLIGGCVAVAMVAAFIAKQGTRQISEMDVALTAAFIAVLAGSAFVLTQTHWGRSVHRRSKRKLNDQDAKVRANARTKGEVRRPLWWWLP